VLAPAIALAKDGHRIGARQALTLRWAWPVLRRDAAARAIFGHAGKPLRKGALLRQPDLAATLGRIAEQGKRGFYEGVTAERLVASMKKGGMISAADLRGYTAAEREPLAITYRGVGVRIAPPPSAGGVAVAQMLLLLNRHRIWEHHGADALHLFAEIARRVHPTRRFDVVDPDSLSPAEVRAKRAGWLDVERLDESLLPIDPAHATPSSKVHPLYDAAVRELEHTTHLSVVDADGMAVSLTTTLSAGFGARFVAAGTGVVLNNAVAAFGTAGADVPAPGRRMTTSMSPTLLVDGDDTVAVLGSPGGDTIPNTVVQLVLRIIDDQMTVDAAVEAPRVHHGFVPDEIRYEKDRPVPRAALTELERRGHRISKKRIPIGDANVVVVVDGVSYGYADSREGGLALGPASAVREKP
jgi:gamma-glutamyltranspeptidase/glutathione hydrolase